MNTLPCLCGRKWLTRWDVFENGKWHVELRCKCGLTVWGKDGTEAIENWNKVITEEREK